MTDFEKFFGGNIFVINLARRPDRLASFTRCMDSLGIKFERFDAIDYGPNMGNHACCASHKAVMDLIVKRGLERAAVFEDDSVIRPEFASSFHDEVAAPLKELPEAWGIVYLGGGYGDDPRGWQSKHLIRINSMKTTSSYGITAEAARGLRDYIPDDCGQGIDDIFSGYFAGKEAFITEPRFFVQYNNYSDLQRAVLDNGQSMTDCHHVARLGKYRPL